MKYFMVSVTNKIVLSCTAVNTHRRISASIKIKISINDFYIAKRLYLMFKWIRMQGALFPVTNDGTGRQPVKCLH